MEIPMHIEALRQQLNRTNGDIAALMSVPPIDLPRQSGAADADMLFLYGIVGGKDVGKTSLINQLAGAVISKDTDILDEGTRVTMAYCHQADLPKVKQRLKSYNDNRILFSGHNRPELQNVVLMDLPDYDSRYESHLADVNELSRYLQGLIWVTTPRKYGDDEFLKKLAAAAQSHLNYYIILNKMDQLDDRAATEMVRQEVYGYISKECAKRRIQAPDVSHLFLVSAINPEKYDFKRMHDRLIRPHTAQEIAHAKKKNLAAEFEQNLDRIRSTYQLERHVALIDEAVAWVNTRVGEQFGEEYSQAVSRRVSSQESLLRRVSKTIFSQRVKRWPILRTLLYPVAGLSTILTGTLRAVFNEPSRDKEMDALFLYEGNTPAVRLFQIRDDLLAAYPNLNKDMGEEPDFPDLVHHHATHLINAYENNLVDHFTTGKRSPGLIKRLLIYLPLVWFPFLQPFLLKVSGLTWQQPVYENLSELVVFLISLLGAKALLTSLTFLGLFYTIILMVMYAQSGRLVQKQGKGQFQDLWYGQFLYAISETLVQPLSARRAALSVKIDELARIEQELQAEGDPTTS